MMDQTTLCIKVKAIHFGDHLERIKLEIHLNNLFEVTYIGSGFTVEVNFELGVSNFGRRMLINESF